MESMPKKCLKNSVEQGRDKGETKRAQEQKMAFQSIFTIHPEIF